MPRYRIEIDYESDTEWSAGALPTVPAPEGEPATGDEVADVLERVARLWRENFSGSAPGVCVKYPAADPEN